jgi:hypothetical protein
LHRNPLPVSIDPNAELKARTRVSWGNDSGLNDPLRIFNSEQFDDYVLEPDRNRVFIFKYHLDAEHVLVKGLRGL